MLEALEAQVAENHPQQAQQQQQQEVPCWASYAAAAALLRQQQLPSLHLSGLLPLEATLHQRFFGDLLCFR